MINCRHYVEALLSSNDWYCNLTGFCKYKGSQESFPRCSENGNKEGPVLEDIVIFDENVSETEIKEPISRSLDG